MGKGIVDELKKEFDIEDEWIPYELHPEIPAEGKKVSDLFPYMSVSDMFLNLNQTSNKYNINFCGADLISNTHASLIATEYAKEKGKFHQFHDNVFFAYFNEGKNIGNLEILKSIAENTGLDGDEMIKIIGDGSYKNRLEKARSLANQYGISSTPTFIINDKYSIVGAQSIDSFKSLLNK